MSKQYVENKAEAKAKLMAVMNTLLDVATSDNKQERLTGVGILRDELEKIYRYIDNNIW